MVAISILVFDDDVEALEDLAVYSDLSTRDAGMVPVLTKVSDWDEVVQMISDPSRQFDLVVTDTYKDGGKGPKTDDAVTNVIQKIRGKKSIPVLMCSTAIRPDWFQETAFLAWADKTKPKEIKDKITSLIATEIPSIVRSVKDEIDSYGGKYLWDFLESNWGELENSGSEVLERIIRKRLATLIAHSADEDGVTESQHIDSCEFYHYPPISEGISLGEIIQHKENEDDWRVVLTPHCYLTIQAGNDKPRTDFVLTVKLQKAELHTEKWENGLVKVREENNTKKISEITSPGGAARVKKPEGRNWFLPSFLQIPSSYLDFEQVESVPYRDLVRGFDRIAVLCAPFAEAMQQSFASYYSSVGMPNLRTESISEVLAAKQIYEKNGQS